MVQPSETSSAGQIWFDTSNSKLKFYDGSKFRTTGGAEVSATAPGGLTTGDFWWDSANSQLYAWDGTSFMLVGPQGTGSSVTQFTTRQIKDTFKCSTNLIIEGKVNNTTVVIIQFNRIHNWYNTDPKTQLQDLMLLKKVLHLVNTQAATNGVTTTDHRYWGTASNSDRLGGFLQASDYIRSGSSAFASYCKIW